MPPLVLHSVLPTKPPRGHGKIGKLGLLLKINNLHLEGITHNIFSRGDRTSLSEKMYVVGCLGFHIRIELRLHDVGLAG